MTKIDIFSGFLGAGKTTLIKKLLKEAYAGEKLVLIENEFGEIGIDGGFLQDAGINITEMNSGCICCSLVGDFTKALAKVLDDFHPDRILIEPSGVGKLSDIIRAVKKVDRDDVMLNCFTTVADVNKCRMYIKNFGEFYNDQVSHASAIVFSHTDKTTDAKLAEAVALIREHNPDAVIITTPLEELSGADILAAMERKDTLAEALERLAAESEHEHHHHHHHHDEDGDEHECHCHHHDEDGDEHECHCHHHDDDEDEHECHCHHHDDDDEDEHECHCHHHHDDDGDEDEHECHCHHHHDDDGDEDEHECHHHHHDDDDDDDGEECSCGCGHHHHHHDHDADEVFTSFGAETAQKFTPEKIKEVLETFAEDDSYGMILRAKGILPSTDGRWIHFDYVPGEPDVRFGSAIVMGRLCVIGSDLKEEEIKKLFGI